MMEDCMSHTDARHCHQARPTWAPTPCSLPPRAAVETGWVGDGHRPSGRTAMWTDCLDHRGVSLRGDRDAS